MSFFGDVQARRDTAKMQIVRDQVINRPILGRGIDWFTLLMIQADWLLTNIIPSHAVESMKINTKYSENHKLTAVLFASITNWNEMYEETFEGSYRYINNARKFEYMASLGGREFIRVLNEVIGDFDELLDRTEFTHIEKIKTIGATYMAASGLNPDKRRLSLHPYEHLYQVMIAP